MTRGRFYSAAFPIWSILYVIGLMVFHNSTFAAVGAMVYALIAVVGTALFHPGAGEGRMRERHRTR